VGHTLPHELENCFSACARGHRLAGVCTARARGDGRLVGVIGGIGGAIGGIVGNVLRRHWHDAPWNNKMWREVAQRFIGEELTPVLDRPLAEGAVKGLLAQAHGNPRFSRSNE